jgi:hypothetical protein
VCKERQDNRGIRYGHPSIGVRRAEEKGAEEVNKDPYAVVKGKALTMVREFLKVYPDVKYNECMKRIVYEVLFSANEVIGWDFKRSKTQQICKEIKEIITNEF